MKDFIQEVRNMETEDISLILSDQRNLYSKDELRVLENELLSRQSSSKDTFNLQCDIANRKVRQDIKKLIVTTGHTIDGYVIEKYIDVLFIERLVGIGIKTSLRSVLDNFSAAISYEGEELSALTEKITLIKHEALKALKIEAVKLGANALIGIDFETTLPDGSAILTSVSGTAVVVKKK